MYRGLFCLSRDIMHRKSGAGDAIGKGRWSVGRPFEKSDHLLVELPVKKAFLSTIQADLSFTPHILKALGLDVLIPGVVRVPIKMIVIDFLLKCIKPIKIAGCFVTGSIPHFIWTENWLSSLPTFPPVFNNPPQKSL